ncbi:MAG TPA: PQQ-dependent sugar dehydrogenase [Planctomycetota bacterium]|nr:PQQ-dependent sugar dehydrogenase [Planctomycetota bacterium]
MIRTISAVVVGSVLLGCASGAGPRQGKSSEQPSALYTSAPPVQEINCARPGGKVPGDPKIQLIEVAGGFVDPIHVASAKDGSGRLFVCERVGRIKIIGKNGKVMDEPFYDNFANTFFQFLECGLYAVEFHPKFKENGLLYVSYADMWFNGATMIVEYRVDKGDPNKVDMTTARPVMRIDFPYANHHGGKIAFGPDGYLYVGVGDGGWEGDVLDAGPDLSTWMGKMLRIDVNQKAPPMQYRVPESNPFVKASEVKLMTLFGVSELEFSRIKQRAKAEIWAYGLRNPWTFSFDRKTGDLWIADIGQNHWEEVNLQPASSKGGENYGWNWMCGTHPFPLEKEQQGEKTPLVGVLPVAEYSHAEGNNCVINFGIYRGAEFPGLDGVYFCGDWGSGRVWAVKKDDAGKWQMQQVLDTKVNFTAAGEDEHGNLFVTSAPSQYGTWNPFQSGTGSVWKLVAADKVPAGAKAVPTE